MAVEIVPYMYDVNTVKYAVRVAVTGRYIADNCETVQEAERCRAEYLRNMHFKDDNQKSVELLDMACRILAMELPGCEDAAWEVAKIDPLLSKDVTKEDWLVFARSR